MSEENSADAESDKPPPPPLGPPTRPLVWIALKHRTTINDYTTGIDINDLAVTTYDEDSLSIRALSGVDAAVSALACIIRIGYWVWVAAV